jgi:hypothetical protein
MLEGVFVVLARKFRRRNAVRQIQRRAIFKAKGLSQASPARRCCPECRRDCRGMPEASKLRSRRVERSDTAGSASKIRSPPKRGGSPLAAELFKRATMLNHTRHLSPLRHRPRWRRPGPMRGTCHSDPKNQIAFFVVQPSWLPQAGKPAPHVIFMLRGDRIVIRLSPFRLPLPRMRDPVRRRLAGFVIPPLWD